VRLCGRWHLGSHDPWPGEENGTLFFFGGEKKRQEEEKAFGERVELPKKEWGEKDLGGGDGKRTANPLRGRFGVTGAPKARNPRL